MDSRMRNELDNWITGHYGEDQIQNGICTCGHVEEDHTETDECQVPGCLCACYEEAED